MIRKPYKVGTVFNNWTLLEEVEAKFTLLKTGQKHYDRRFLVRCICGKEVIRMATHIIKGTSKSCGCTANYNYIITHNKSKTLEYRTYHSMLSRCFYEKHKDFPAYGGSGITVCKRWLGENGFVNFLKDMGTRPTPKHTLDRFPDKKGNYSPSNCRWATQKEQCRNLSKNVHYDYNGKLMTIGEISDATGINKHTLKSRIYYLKWSVEKAVNTAIKHY